MQAGLEMLIKKENWVEAAKGAGNLSELFLTLGDVAAAVSWSRQSVDFADRSGKWDQKMMWRTALANAQHQAGELAAAAALFQEAESLQAQRQPVYRYLYSLQGFQYCDLLLSQCQVRDVLARAELLFEIGKRDNVLLEIALGNLALGRAYLLKAAAQMDSTSKVAPILEQAMDSLNQAVTGLRKAGTQDHLPRGLFAQAMLYRLHQDFPRAWEDLAQAQELAERGSMKLFLVDYHLEAFQLRIASISDFGLRISETAERQNILAPAKADLEQAEKLIQETGYHRRDPEVEMGYASLFFAQKEPTLAREHLAKVKKLLEKMGIRMCDGEIKRLEGVSGRFNFGLRI
jgi:tetratricopeptide (TPR) repeat protein